MISRNSSDSTEFSTSSIPLIGSYFDNSYSKSSKLSQTPFTSSTIFINYTNNIA